MKKNTVKGILEILDDGYGFLREPQKNFAIQEKDIHVSRQLIDKWGLREGLLIEGKVKPQKNGHPSPSLLTVLKCNDQPVETYETVPELKSGTSIDPEQQLKMRLGPDDITGRAMDLIAPMGQGQRGLIISPPKAGKTTILKHIARAISVNHPETNVIILLIDERPEEVTDFQRALPGAAVFHSSADQDVSNHLRITRLTMNMAIRKVEFGEDVMILVDSLTRMGRAFNKDSNSGGKTLSGGLSVNALELPRRFFGAARKIEDNGSLTILATILVDTGSRMDEVIFQEFKGTGNWELVLSRECAEQRMFPAIDIRQSGTRKEHKLLSLEDQDESNYLRRRTADSKPPQALQSLLEYLRKQQD